LIILHLVLLTVLSETLSVGTWNVLSIEDEYNSNWGCPLQIALCNTTRESCTRRRYQRIWNVLENIELDVMCLQEVSETFVSIQSNSSKWRTVASSGACAVLLSTMSNYQVTNVYNVTMSGLSGCPFVPVAAFSESVAVASVHVQASVVDMSSWYDMAVIALQDASLHDLNYIVGGDYNHNLTTDTAMPSGWRLAFGSDIAIRGTTQKEFNWMGNFDGFLFSPLILLSHVDVLVTGFMPKVVRNLPQGGVTQTVAQFEVSTDSELLFSPTSSAPFQQVPFSNPRMLAMSDHLLVSALYEWNNESTEVDSSLSPSLGNEESSSPNMLSATSMQSSSPTDEPTSGSQGPMVFLSVLLLAAFVGTIMKYRAFA
jgi:hypothetical protein